MPAAVVIDGEPIEPEDARIPVLDRGFLYGDSAFEVIRTYNGRPFTLDEHLARLARSCAKLAIPAFDADAVRADVDLALRAAGNDESYIRVIVTRGITPIGIGVPELVHARRVVVVLPLTVHPAEMYERGVEVATVSGARAFDGTMATGAKASNYLPNILWLESARARGAYEAIVVAPGGELLEGSTSNLFVVRGGVVSTPPLAVGILGGITRQVVIEAAHELGVALVERLLFPPDLYGADEAFITSTTREVVPVVRVDGVVIGTGEPGPVTKRLHDGFRAAVRLRMSH